MYHWRQGCLLWKAILKLIAVWRKKQKQKVIFFGSVKCNWDYIEMSWVPIEVAKWQGQSGQKPPSVKVVHQTVWQGSTVIHQKK